MLLSIREVTSTLSASTNSMDVLIRFFYRLFRARFKCSLDTATPGSASGFSVCAGPTLLHKPVIEKSFITRSISWTLTILPISSFLRFN